MKDRIQLLAVTVMTLMVMDTRANVQFQPLNNTFLPGYGFITAGKEKQTAPPFILEDPFLLLQKNYPLVYNHLLHEFKNAASLIYSVEGNAILISFSSNSNRVFAVYSIDGEFRYSVENIGLALPRIITEQLHEEYPAYSVYYGKEIRTKNKNMYQVVIENKYGYRVINFLDAEMEEVERLKK